LGQKGYVRKNGLKKTENKECTAYGKKTITWTEHFSALCSPVSEQKSIALFAGSQAPPVCPSEKNIIEMKMGTEHWWNYTGKAERKFLNRKLSQCQFVRQNDPQWNPDTS